MVLASCAVDPQPEGQGREIADGSSAALVRAAFHAAFVTLERIDIYDESGNEVLSLGTADENVAFLEAGTYLVDFIAEDGSHAFHDDGRMAFGVAVDGGTLAAAPVTIATVASPLWAVRVGHVRDGEGSVASVNSALLVTDTNERAQRLRVIWEASFAMKGDFGAGCNGGAGCWDGFFVGDAVSFALATNGRSSPSGRTYYSYIDYDPDAWQLLRRQTEQYPAGYVSCRDLVPTPSGCKVPNAGSADALRYACQGTCTGATHPRGGQCKAFANLLLYRSGAYRMADGISWLPLPNDSTLSVPDTLHWPRATTANIAAGDLLRSPGGHAAVVVTAPPGGPYRVVDSNWVGSLARGESREYIGSHAMSFSGSGLVDDLSTYMNVKCVYASGDRRCVP